MNKRNKNGGFTLVEVLVAVTILAIVTTPLLRMFTSAARTNAKARKVMQATTIAQNLTEDIKAYTIEEIARSANNYTVDADGNAFSINFTEATSYEAKCTEDANGTLTSVTPVVKTEDGAGTPDSSIAAKYSVIGGVNTLTSTEFVGNSDNKYYFVYQDISLDSRQKKYDAVVKLESTYSTEIASISSMSESDNAYYVEPDTQQDLVANEFASRVPGATVAASELNSKLSKLVNVVIGKDASGNVTVSLGTDYTCSSTYVTDDTYSIPSKVIFNNFVSKQNLKAVYIYYYPIYASDAKDSFKIINTTGEKITVYLISMLRNTGVLTASQIANYKARLVVSEDAMGITESCLNTKICSNVDSLKWTTVATVSGLGNTSNESFKYDATIWIYEYEDNFSADSDRYVLKFTASKLDIGK